MPYLQDPLHSTSDIYELPLKQRVKFFETSYTHIRVRYDLAKQKQKVAILQSQEM